MEPSTVSEISSSRLESIIRRLDEMDAKPSGYSTQHASNIMDIYSRLAHLVVGAVAGTAMVGASIWALVEFFRRLIGA